MRDAATLAGPTVMARRATAVRCGEDRDPADRDDPFGREPLGHAVPDHLLGAVQRHRREELPLRGLGTAEGIARDSDELLHLIEPLREVRVTDPAVHSEPAARIPGHAAGAPA